MSAFSCTSLSSVCSDPTLLDARRPVTGRGIFCLGEGVEVKADPSEFSGKEPWIGVGQMPDGIGLRIIAGKKEIQTVIARLTNGTPD